MSNQSSYKAQQKLSFGQFLSELPNFIAVLVSAIISKSLITFVDLLDSFGNVLRTAIVTMLSKKLSKNLKFEYNYGIGKVEAISALLCDGIVFFGLLSMVGLSIYEIFSPSKPSDLLIAVVGLKVINVTFDTIFFIGQRKILKSHRSAVSQTNYAAATASLLFDSVTLLSLLIVWLLRNNVVGGYISPVISIAIALFLMVSCVKRIKGALEEVTDKTLPEDIQLKILAILTGFYQRYTQLCAIKSRKSGDAVIVDLHLSFAKDTTFKEIVGLKNDLQLKINNGINNCVVNIVVQDEDQS